MSDKQTSSIIQSVAGLTSLTERINEICGRMSTPNYTALQTALKGSALWATSIRPTESVMDVVLKGSALSAVLAAPSKWSLNTSEVGAFSTAAATKNALSPSLSALAAMEMHTGELARRNGIAHITSVASQLTSITDVLSSQTRFVREMIAPSTMLLDLQKVAERTHKSITEAGSVTAWKLGVLDSASFLADRQISWASNFWSTTPDIEPFLKVDELGEFTPNVNLIEQLPEELEYERSKNEDITPAEALEQTPSFLLQEKGFGLVERIVNINKTCQRLKRKPMFTLTNATILAAATFSGTVCINSRHFGKVIDGLYFVFYENLKHIKEVVTDEAVRNEDVYQCIFRVKDMRTDIRHDYEHGDNIEKKTRDIAESYSHYTGKVVLTSTDDFITTQDKLYDDFYALTDHLQETIEKEV